MSNVDPNAKLFYLKTGRPAEIIGTEPIVRYRVLFSNGHEALMTESDIQSKFTNEQPRYMFSMHAEGLSVESIASSPHFVRFNSAKSWGRSQHDLDVDAVRRLHERLGRWLSDRAKDNASTYFDTTRKG